MKNFRLIREAGGIREYEHLKNGLRVLLNEDHSAPVATVMIAYEVGARNERLGHTGASHMLEHMMFKGSRAYQRKLGNSMFALLQQTGAKINASTGMDTTDYFETLPAGRIPLALETEADRMRNALLLPADFAAERDVILNELEGMDNSPVLTLMKQVWKTAYEKHPYRHLAIGLREDVASMTVDGLATFYNRYYWPDNAVLIVVGDFNTVELLSQIDRIFSGILRSPGKGAPEPIAEPEQQSKRTVTVERPDQLEAVYLVSKSPGGSHSDILALEVLSQILSGGKNSRLYRELVDSKLAVEVSASVTAYRDPGLFEVLALLAPGVAHQDVENKILEIYRKVREDGVLAGELETAKRQLWAHEAYAWDGTEGVAHGLSEAEAAGDWTLFPAFRKDILGITAAEVQRVARRYLGEETMTAGRLVSKPGSAPPLAAPSGAEPSGREEAASDRIQVLPEIPGGGGGTARIQDRAVIDDRNGIRTIAVKTAARDVISLAGSFYGAGQAFSENPALAAITAGMLDLGTLEHDKYQIAQMLEDRGVQLVFETGPTRAGFFAKLLKENLEETVRLIAEQLRRPAFAQEELEKVKQQLLVLIEHQRTDTESAAAQALAEMIYPEGHPNYERSFDDQARAVKEVTIEEVRKFHAAHYGKNAFLVTAAGDVDASALSDLFRKAFGDWPSLDVRPAFETNVRAGAPKSRTIEIKGKGNLDLCFGHGVPITRKHPDWPAVTLALFGLGGDFSSRLTASIRDTYGLSYSVYSRMEGVTGEIEGHWLVHLMTLPSLAEEARRRTLDEIRRFVREGLAPDELKRNQNTLIGRSQMNFATTGSIAEQIRRVEETGVGIRYLDEFQELIRKLTPEDVRQVIARYFHPEQLNFVLAGEPGTPEP
ncbi:MAG: pitrilysin family protein [Candidatus Omnitrophota bacterium]